MFKNVRNMTYHLLSAAGQLHKLLFPPLGDKSKKFKIVGKRGTAKNDMDLLIMIRRGSRHSEHIFYF